MARGVDFTGPSHQNFPRAAAASLHRVRCWRPYRAYACRSSGWEVDVFVCHWRDGALCATAGASIMHCSGRPFASSGSRLTSVASRQGGIGRDGRKSEVDID